MPARSPLPVEVVTKIPANLGGLGLADPGVTGGITRASQTAQTAARTAAVEVVTDIPGKIRNITPISLGQRAAAIGKIGVQIGSKAVGVGLGVLGDLAQDLLFPAPVGVGSDMVGGIKIGSQPKPAPITNPVSSQPSVKPQVTSAPFKPPAPKMAPVSAPTKPQTQTQTQTQTEPQPLRVPTTTRPQSAPSQTQPKPISLATPTPRSPLATPLPSDPKPLPLNTESPFPLNIVDLNSYGGVNLTYPIAQKLIKLPEEISEILQPTLNKIEIQLSEIPERFEETLKKTRIETNIILPTKIDLTSQIPLQLDLSKQIPVAVDFSKEVPVAVGISSQLPVTVDLSKQVPVAIGITSQLPVNLDLSKEVPVAVGISSQLPVTVDLSKEVPVAVGISSQLPVTVDLSKQVPVAVGITSQLPVNVDLSKQIPVAVGISSQLPVTVDLSTLLRPDEASGLKDLQKCCENIQTILKKKEEIFEGTGNLICDDGTTPYSYKGVGLNGIHQLVKIILAANGQILEKICALDVSSTQETLPLIQGSGIYNCGTLPPTVYNYSGVGLLGIQNQIDQLFNLDKTILTEICDSSLMGSLPFPQISGQIEYFDCDRNTQAILYSGNGIEGLSQQIHALTTVVKTGVQAACDASSTVIMPDARFEQFKASRQLQITWGTRYPSQQGSLWHSYLPNPIDNLNWCKDFENLYHEKGNIYGQVEWEDSKVPTGIYCNSEEEATRILLSLVRLSNARPTSNEFNQPKILIQKGNSVKRKIQERTLRAVRVAISEIGDDGNPSSVQCFTPPIAGC